MNYYNEIDPYAAMWLQELIKAGHFPRGDVDTRSIAEVDARELVDYTQCHFFAGIAGWALALKLAEWPVTRRVWTGSCPCQPFSVAGRQKGEKDDRHLWPVWERLIAKCRPATVFGEQVASAISQHWLDLVSTDLEASGYAVGAAVFTAACAGAPHIRDRLYWVGDAKHGRPISSASAKRSLTRDASAPGKSTVAHASGSRLERTTGQSIRGKGARPSVNGDVANIRPKNWTTSSWAACTDNARRPFERGSFPLAYGVSKGVGRVRTDTNFKRLHGYGNAIVPQQAALFIRSVM